MPKDIFNQTSSSISSKPVGEAQGFATTTQADLNNDVVELYLSFLSPDEIAKIKRVSWGYYEGVNQFLNHYRLIGKDCQEEVGLKFLKLELSNRQNFLLVQNSQGQSQVYAWGVNGFSQLGLGHNNAVTAPSLLPFPGSLANWMLNNIVASGSGNSAFAIFQNAEGQSQVYAWGANELGQLGLGHNNAVTVPTLLPFPDSLAHWTLNNIVASGSGNSAFAIFQNAEGQSQVYAWGDNEVGELGLGHNNAVVNRPTLLPFPDSLAHWTLNNIVSSGDNTFTIFQNAEGQSQVYAWGYNCFGQLGLGHNNAVVNRPTLLPFPDSLAHWTLNNIFASRNSAFAIFQNQGQSQVYAWGANRFGQLGLGHNNRVTAPTLLPFPDSLANWTLNNIVCGENHFFAIFQNAEGQSQVYAWGANRSGELGLGHDNDVNRPSLLPFPDSLANWTLNNIVSSKNSTFAIFQNQGQSQVYAWGANRSGQLGLGHYNDMKRPSLLPFPDSLANWTLNNIVSRGTSTFAIFQNAEGQKQVYAWGYNKFGQLGLGHNNSVHTPTLIPFFKGATGPGQLPLQKRKILNSLTRNSEADFSSTGVSSNQSSSSSSEWVNKISKITAEWSTPNSSSLNTGLMNAYLSSQSSLSQTASSSLTAELEQKCVTVAQP